MTHPTIEYKCSHDPNHPDHLTCIKNTEITPSSTQESSENQDTSPAISIKNISIDQQTAKTIVDILRDRYAAYYHPERKQFLLHRTVDVVLALIISALIFFIGYILIVGPPSFTKIDILISQEDQIITSGDVISFNVTIKNTSREKIKNPILLLRIPPNFTLLEPSGAIINTQTATITFKKEFRKNERIILHLKGIAIGQIQERQTISASVEGDLSDGSVAQSRPEILSYEIEDSVLETTFNMPDRIIPFNSFEGTVHILNRSSAPIDNVYVTLDMPDNFTATSKEEYENEIFIQHIPSHEQHTIPIKGLLSSSKEGKMSITVYLKKEGKTLVQRQSEVSLRALTSELDLNLRFSEPTTSLSPGKPANLLLSWKNNSHFELSDVQLIIAAEGFGLTDSSLLSDNAHHPKPLQIIWTKNQLPDLKKIPPNGSGSVSFILKPSDTHVLAGIQHDNELEITLHSNGKYTHEQKTYTSSGKDLKISLTTLPTIQAALRYFTPEGDQIGRGPLPPKSGKSTNFYAFFDISNSIHPLDQTRLTITHIPEITITNIIPPQFGHFLHDPAKHVLIWDIGTLPAKLTQQSRQTGISIELNYTPSSSTSPNTPLITDITLTGTDAITHTPIQKKLKDLTIDQLKGK